MLTGKDLNLKHGALVNFASGLSHLLQMPWYEYEKVARRLAETGKPTKDLTLFEVMQAIQAVQAEAGNDVVLPQHCMEALRQAVAS